MFLKIEIIIDLAVITYLDRCLLKTLKYVGKKDKIISSTGYLSRDLYYHILKLKLKIYPFYMVGGMGHTSSVSLGYSLKTNNKVICLDGDGSFLMHLGSAVSITKYSKKI